MSENSKSYEAIIAQYNAASSSNKSSGSKFSTSNYFTTFLKPGINSATKTIRILPAKVEGETPFVEMWGHTFQLADGQWKTFTCLKHEEDKACPFCDVNSELYSSGTEEDKEQAKKYRARKFYIARVIDRELEADGVKFWRFRDNYQKQGTLDKIFNVMTLVKGNIADATAEAGQDLSVSIARNQNNVPIVQTILPLPDKTRLHEDVALETEWLSDTKTWKDVYSIKPYEYLEIIIKGGTPTYDNVNEKWVDKDTFEAQNSGSGASANTKEDLDSELEMGNSNAGLVAEESAPVDKTVTPELVDTKEAPEATPDVTTEKTPEPALESATTEDGDDDMPF